VRVVLEHARLHCAQYGEKGIVSFRKHLAWYFKTNKIGFEVPGIKDIREKLVRVSSLAELEEILTLNLSQK
jgi:tRNA-dihydrouridine synthase